MSLVSYPLAPGLHWLSWNHLYASGKCLCIPFFPFVACPCFRLLYAVFVLQLSHKFPFSQVSLLLCLFIFKGVRFLCLEDAVLKNLAAFLSRFTLQIYFPLNPIYHFLNKPKLCFLEVEGLYFFLWLAFLTSIRILKSSTSFSNKSSTKSQFLLSSPLITLQCPLRGPELIARPA